MPMTEQEREREMDRVRAKIFIGANSAFYGPLMASLNFVWTDKVETSATDYVNIYWNPKDFEALGSTDKRVASMMHEIEHNTRLHGLRQGERDRGIWNLACDIPINRGLRKDGYDATGPMFLGDMPQIKAELEEKIYEDLLKNAVKIPAGGGCSCHQLPTPSKEQQQASVRNLVQAVQQAKLAGKPGHIPGNVEGLLDTFLKPKIPWRQHISQFMIELGGIKFSLQRPNRRYLSHGLVMKSRIQDYDRLAHLVLAFDLSGSVSDEQAFVFMSEMKYIKDTYQPKKMTLLLFDTKIQSVTEFTDADEFTKLKVRGRGGTDFRDVRKYIMDKDHGASAALIFSDMWCDPMEPGPKIPILWISIDNPTSQVPFGKLIHVNSGDLV